jgi:Recombination directionality factor-like
VPVPIIDLQRRLTLVGAIRAGERGDKGAPRRLEHWRLTSQSQPLIEQAARLYGGAATPWQSPSGPQWQVTTEADEIPVLVIPGYSLQQTYELWEGPSKRTRLCDGLEEQLTGSPCICQATGEDLCDLYTRLVVALPELDTVLGWRLITRGASAGHELPTMMALVERFAGGAAFVPARLRLDQRRGMKDGQATRFVVPTVDLATGYLGLAEQNHRRELPSYEPVAAREISVDTALQTVTQAQPRTSGGRQAAPIPAPQRERRTDPIPVEPDEERQTLKATEPQKTKLNVLVGQLRDQRRINTEQIWMAVAQIREVSVLELIKTIGGYDDERVLHWSPLRETLTRPEANQLIDRLEAFEKGNQ